MSDVSIERNDDGNYELAIAFDDGGSMWVTGETKKEAREKTLGYLADAGIDDPEVEKAVRAV